MIDLRSDTVTRPTPGMLDAMMRARVGDDVFGEDPEVNALQERAAALFGKDAALFCPSGTMTNQVGLRVHLMPGDEVVCHELAHMYRFEAGGIAVNSGASVRLLSGNDGRFSAATVESEINPDDPHFPRTRVVAIENTVSRGGGCCWDLAAIQAIRAVASAHGLAMHLDGARIFNALVARGELPDQYGPLFDTISFCLSKGLGAPIGSMLVGSREVIERANRHRKVMGGAMRQAGYLAAAGSYGLAHHVARLAEDHAHARATAAALATKSYVERVLPAETNIVLFWLADGVGLTGFLRHLESRGIKAMGMGRIVRLVFHLDVDPAGTDQVLSALDGFAPTAA